jgi:hypothetical protein
MKLVIEFYLRVVEVKLFACSTGVTAHNESVTVVRAMYVAARSAKGRLRGVPEEPAQFAKASD